MKSIEYILPTVTLQPTDCSYIMAPILSAGLSHSGICQTINCLFVYAPIELQGLGITDLYTMSGIQQLLILLQYGQTSQSTNLILHNNIVHTLENLQGGK